MKKNTRQRNYPQPHTAEKNKQKDNEKEKAKRARCRASITNTDVCKGCSLGGVCSNEATNNWLKKHGNESEEENPESP